MEQLVLDKYIDLSNMSKSNEKHLIDTNAIVKAPFLNYKIGDMVKFEIYYINKTICINDEICIFSSTIQMKS